ncbi:SDR family NAD(P)-dependent oxidoreductase [Roseobacteraceae bacterium S113]
MNDWQGKRYWLVGASEGLGEALAHVMSGAGVELVLSARSVDKLQAIADVLPGKATAVPCDVGDLASVQAAREAAGEIDGVVMLAGVYWPQGADAWDQVEVETMCDINFTGTARVVGSVVKDFVARDAGHIVITGSLSGFRGLPGAQGYAASKAGTMAMAESLYCDLHRTNVKVQLANPGFIRTRLTDKNDFNMPFIMEPDAAARQMFEHMCGDAFKMSFPRVFSWLFRGSQFLPDWLYYRLFA